MIGSAARRSTSTKATAATTVPAISAMMTAESQSYVVPPQVVTSTRQVDAMASRPMPAQSSFGLLLRALRQAQEDHGGEDGEDAERDVHPERPAPADAFGEPAAEQRAGDGRQGEDAAHDAHVAYRARGRGRRRR